MNTIFMNSDNSKTSDSQRVLINLTDNIDLQEPCKNLQPYKNNKFKISAPRCNEGFELPFGSYSLPVIQDYFEYMLKKHG